MKHDTHDTFGTYLVKHADPITDLVNAANAGGDTVKIEANAVQEASKASGMPISKTKAALLVALGVSVGAGGTLVYQHMKGKKK